MADQGQGGPYRGRAPNRGDYSRNPYPYNNQPPYPSHYPPSQYPHYPPPPQYPPQQRAYYSTGYQQQQYYHHPQSYSNTYPLPPPPPLHPTAHIPAKEPPVPKHQPPAPTSREQTNTKFTLSKPKAGSLFQNSRKLLPPSPKPRKEVLPPISPEYNTPQTPNFNASPVPDETKPPCIQRPGLIPVSLSLGNYERMAQCGEGTYGKVYKARHKTSGQLVALKRLRIETEREGFPVTGIREIRILTSLTHTNIISLLEIISIPDGSIHMVFEYMDYDLTGILSSGLNFSPAHIKCLTHQMFTGLAYLHSKGIIHRDMKGSNLLLNSEGELKLADFGLARNLYTGSGAGLKKGRGDYTNRVITLWYRPPELLLGGTKYGFAIDLWSAGCIMLELFSRKPVFPGSDEIQLLSLIWKLCGTPDIQTWPGLGELPWWNMMRPKRTHTRKIKEAYGKYVSPEGLKLIEGLLTLDPKGRPSAEQVLEMEYFKEEPRACRNDELPKIDGDWHEFESKQRKKQGQANTNHSMKLPDRSRGGFQQQQQQQQQPQASIGFRSAQYQQQQQPIYSVPPPPPPPISEKSIPPPPSVPKPSSTKIDRSAIKIDRNSQAPQPSPPVPPPLKTVERTITKKEQARIDAAAAADKKKADEKKKRDEEIATRSRSFSRSSSSSFSSSSSSSYYSSRSRSRGRRSPRRYDRYERERYPRGRSPRGRSPRGRSPRGRSPPRYYRGGGGRSRSPIDKPHYRRSSPPRRRSPRKYTPSPPPRHSRTSRPTSRDRYPPSSPRNKGKSALDVAHEAASSRRSGATTIEKKKRRDRTRSRDRSLDKKKRVRSRSRDTDKKRRKREDDDDDEGSRKRKKEDRKKKDEKKSRKEEKRKEEKKKEEKKKSGSDLKKSRKDDKKDTAGKDHHEKRKSSFDVKTKSCKEKKNDHESKNDESKEIVKPSLVKDTSKDISPTKNDAMDIHKSPVKDVMEIESSPKIVEPVKSSSVSSLVKDKMEIEPENMASPKNMVPSPVKNTCAMEIVSSPQKSKSPSSPFKMDPPEEAVQVVDAMEIVSSPKKPSSPARTNSPPKNIVKPSSLIDTDAMEIVSSPKKPSSPVKTASPKKPSSSVKVDSDDAMEIVSSPKKLSSPVKTTSPKKPSSSVKVDSDAMEIVSSPKNIIKSPSVKIASPEPLLSPLKTTPISPNKQSSPFAQRSASPKKLDIQFKFLERSATQAAPSGPLKGDDEISITSGLCEPFPEEEEIEEESGIVEQGLEIFYSIDGEEVGIPRNKVRVGVEHDDEVEVGVERITR